MESKRTPYIPDTVSVPGSSLRKVLSAVGMSQAQLATRLGKTEKYVSEIINGKAPITPESAIHLERVLGTPASFWNNRERIYREWLARKAEAEELSKQEDWFKLFPVRKMIQYKWLLPRESRSDLAQELLSFFGIASPKEWHSLWGEKLPSVAFRKAKKYQVDQYALSAWLRFGEVKAQGVDCADFDKEKFDYVLRKVRSLTTDSPEVFQKALVELCATAGVVVVFTPDLPNTRVSAAARWLNPRKALIQLGLRYKTDDHLWFSFFHEAAHLLRHSKKMLFLETGQIGNAEEEEANKVAGDYLIPYSDYKRFVEEGEFTRRSIRDFATSISISPGVVVGRLQHDGYLEFRTNCNALKQHFEWCS